MKKFALLLGLILILISVGTASQLFNLNWEGDNTLNQTLKFSADNGTKITNAKLRIAPPRSDWRKYNLSFNGENLSTNISIFDKKGLYRFKVKSNNSAFPSNSSLALSISSGNSTLKNDAVNFSSNYPANNTDCDFRQNDFSCGYENFQSQMMLSNLIAYQETGNKTYRKRALNYSLNKYQSKKLSQCAHEENDFNCENDNNPDSIDAPSGLRQGSLIYSLWRVYSITGNETVKELATNYTRGSAKNCDVWGNIWNKSFSCNKSIGQGAMIKGYWTAYLTTGNETYRKIAKNLSSTNKSSPRIASGLHYGFQVTENPTYRKKALNISRNMIENASNLTEREYLDTVIALWRGYRSTDNYGYYYHAKNLSYMRSNYSCSALKGDFQCSFSHIQGLTSRVYWKAFNLQKDQPDRIFNPRFSSYPESGENATFKISMEGDILDPRLNYSYRGSGNWSTCEIDRFEGCELPRQNIIKQGVYKYKVITNSSKFPKNGSFRFAVSLRDQELKTEAENFSSEDPEILCFPWSGDFSCEDSIYQAAMIGGYGESYFQNETDIFLGKLVNLSRGPYRTKGSTSAACDPGKNDFNCQTKSVAIQAEGSQRQGGLIRSLFNSYRNTGNGTLYEIGHNFSEGSAEDCDVWSGDFRCGSSEGQGEMILGYWEAYMTTGNSTYRDIAVNLSKNSLNYSNSTELGRGLWRTYSYTGNSTYRDYAKLNTEKFSDLCVSGCKPLNYTKKVQLLESAYLYGEKDKYRDNYSSFVNNNTTSSGCGPFKSDYRCGTPRVQGDMVLSLREAFLKAPLIYNVSKKLELSKNSVNVGSEFSATCSVRNNLDKDSIRGLSLELDLDSGLSTSDNKTIHAGDLSPNQSANQTWSIKAESQGKQEVRCLLKSEGGMNKTVSKAVDVTQSSDSGGSSSGSSDIGGGVIDTGPPENITINYPMDQNPVLNSSLRELFDIENYWKSEFRSSCFSAQRRLKQDKTILTLNYKCERKEVLLADRVPEDISNKSFRTVREELDNSSLNISYGSRLPQSEWKEPWAWALERKELSLDVETNTTSGGNSSLIRANLSRPVKCEIKRNGEKVYSSKVKNLNYSVELENGSNKIKLNCGEESRVFTQEKNFTGSKSPGDSENRFRELKKEDLLTLLGALIGLIGLGSVIVYRNRLILFKDSLILKWYLRRFEKAVKDNNIEKAIEEYSKMRQHSEENFTKKILESDIDLSRGLRIYLTMDLVEDSVKQDIQVPFEKVESSVLNYMEESEREEVNQLIKNKLNEIRQLKN